ncbi:hypothetical protein J4H92_05690 [Leucobacter weissii]|uniref:Acyl-CoA dehydrogenase/oxidase C-terminal domain-containing protein n=1 Tax=Leucobacter weissii TaxID=1983706 RepID=A0A939MIB0_9MICO|nr:acyl-CoA dehydrogenase family protein [Leucobacter weissii]MBO1901439.1 hypothetical protein [Leucobacter weissii]
MSVLMNTQTSEIGELAAETLAEILTKATEGVSITAYAEGSPLLEWGAIGESGWDLVGVVEEGEGATLRDLTAVAQVWGARLVPLPFIETVLAKRHSEAARAVEGPVTLALPTSTAPSGTGYIPFGRVEGISLALDLDRGEGGVTGVPTVGVAERLDLGAQGSEAAVLSRLSETAGLEVAVVYAASAVGAARRLLDLGIDFAKDRQQFGRPIGSFQAVKHQLADAMMAVQEADTAVINASLVRPEALRASHFAVRRAVDVAEIVMQVHGGLGFTWEMGLHFYLRHMLKAREIIEGIRDHG